MSSALRFSRLASGTVGRRLVHGSRRLGASEGHQNPKSDILPHLQGNWYVDNKSGVSKAISCASQTCPRGGCHLTLILVGRLKNMPFDQNAKTRLAISMTVICGAALLTPVFCKFRIRNNRRPTSGSNLMNLSHLIVRLLSGLVQEVSSC